MYPDINFISVCCLITKIIYYIIPKICCFVLFLDSKNHVQKYILRVNTFVRTGVEMEKINDYGCEIREYLLVVCQKGLKCHTDT